MAGLPSASCGEEVWSGFAGARDCPGLRARPGWLAGATAGASSGCPGREGSRSAPAGAAPPIAGAFVQVAGQQAEGLDVVPGGGGGDGPDVGGQVGGPFGAGAVEVLAADHRGPQRSFRGVVIQRQLRQLLVPGQPIAHSLLSVAMTLAAAGCSRPFAASAPPAGCGARRCR